MALNFIKSFLLSVDLDLYEIKSLKIDLQYKLIRKNMAHSQIEKIDLELKDESLLELSLLEEKYRYAKNIQVALFSDLEDIKKLNYYLFADVKDVDYYTIDTLSESDIDDIDDMDIIVFNKNDEKLKEMLLHNIKAKNLPTKFFVITNKSYLRQKDILREHISGVDKLLKMDFFLEDYILSMEKYLRSNFYSKRLLAHEDEKEIIITDKELFEQKKTILLTKKIFFSLFTYEFDSEVDINSYNIRKIVRECDLILVDKKRKIITFLLLNVIPEFGSELIKKRINNFSITLKEKKRESSFDLIYEK